jgi:hypothetical protein
MLLPGVQSAGVVDIHFTVGVSCERAASLVLRSLISLHNEHHVYWTRKMPPRGRTYWEV